MLLARFAGPFALINHVLADRNQVCVNPPAHVLEFRVNILSAHWALNYTLCWNKSVSSCS